MVAVLVQARSGLIVAQGILAPTLVSGKRLDLQVCCVSSLATVR